MTDESVLSELWRPIRVKLERRLADWYADRLEVARILDAGFIDPTKIRTDLPPLTTWNQILRRLESTPEELRRLLDAVQQDYPNDETVQAALDALEETPGSGARMPVESLDSAPGSRASILHWLQNDWRHAGPCVCVIQGFSGVGKSHTADLLMASRSFPKSSLVEIPEGRTSFQDTLLLVNESLDRDLDTRLLMGGDLASELEKVLTSPILLVIDEFQNCLEADGSPLPGFETFFSRLRVARHHGRILLLSSQALDEESFERVSVRTMGGLSKPEGARVLTNMLAEADRQSEIPQDLIDDVVSWLGGNPRALKMLVASLSHFPLEELIDLDPAVWELRDSRMSPEMIIRLERRLVRKTYTTVSVESQRAVSRLSVHRRSFKYEAIESAISPGLARNATRELIDNFLLERRRNWYSMNPIVREVTAALLPEDQAGYTSAHRAAASYYMRPFKSRRATASRNATNFIEARYHLMAIDNLNMLADIAKLYALHLQKIFDRGTIVPSNKEEISQQIATLDAALTGGSPASDLHYYLARLFLARDGENDKVRAIEELKEAVILPRPPLKAWSLLIDLGEFETVRSALDDGSIETGVSMRIYLRLAKAFQGAGRGDEAFNLLHVGTARLEPVHDVVQFYAAAAKIMAAAGRRDDALGLLRGGIARLAPEHNVVELYQVAAKMTAAAGHPGDALDLLLEGITRLQSEHSVSSLYQDAAKMIAAAGQRGDALDLLLEGITHVSPEHSVVQLYLAAAETMVFRGQKDDALNLLHAGIARVSAEHGASSLYQAAAKMMAAAGHGNQAIDLLREGLTLINPENGVSSLYQDAAKMIAAAGHRGDALNLLREGITRIRPEHGVVQLYQMAAEMMAAEHDSEAIDLLREGINRVGPENGLSLLYQAAAKMMSAAVHNDQAIDLLRTGISRLGPEHNVAPLYQVAAKMMAAAEHHDQAIDLLREGINRVGPEPGGVHLYQTAARMMTDTGRKDQALGLLREGIAHAGIEPGAVHLYRAAARIMAAAGQVDEATKLLGAGRQLGLALPDSLPPPPSPNLSIG